MALGDEITVEVDERLNVIIGLMVRGYTQKQIVNYCSTKLDWGVSKRQLRSYCQRAETELANELKHIDRRAEVYKAYARYGLLFRRAMAEKDYRTAAAMEDRVVALLNLAAPHALEFDWEEELRAAGGDPEKVRSKIRLLLQDGKDAS